MDEYNNKVLSRDDFSALEKFPLNFAKSYKISNVEMKYDNAIEFCLDVLKELGCSIVGNRVTLPVKAISSLLRTVKLAKNTSRDTIVMMTDERQIAIMKFLPRLFYASFQARNKFLLILSVTEMVQMTIRNGMSASSGIAYGTLALLTASTLGNFETAAIFADTALYLQEKVPSKFSESITIYTTYSLVFVWSKPVQSSLTPLINGYMGGMRGGNSAYAIWNLIAAHVWLPFQIGKPLSEISEKCLACASQVEELKQPGQGILMKMFWQTCLNLTGQSKETIKLKGEVFDCDEVVCTSPLHEAVCNFNKLALLVFFGDYKQASKLAIRLGDTFLKTARGQCVGMIETLNRGVALYARALHTKKMKYKKHANNVRGTVKKWMVNGNPNVKHYYCFLSAEQAALDKKYEAAGSLYKEAILLSTRTGHLHNTALFNERYANFLLEEMSDKDEANYRMEEAIRFYNLWGADAKVHALQQNR